MKKSVTVLLILTLLSVGIKAVNAQEFSQEEEAVIGVIEKESEAFTNRDYNSWKNTWLHDKSVSHVVASKFYHNELHGWSEVNSFIESIIKNQAPIEPRIHKNYQIRISGELATVSYDGYSRSDDGKLSEIQEKGFRALVKRDGEWKIAQVIGTMPSSYSLSVEWDINAAGYSLLNNGNVDAAIKVFKVNTSIFPKSSNVWDSLGEAQMEAGQKEAAIKNYRKSLALDPENSNAKKMIEKLSVTSANASVSARWFAAGSHPTDYDMGGNPAVEHGSEEGGYITSKESQTEGFGTWMTKMDPAKYLGKRLRISGYVKTKEVKNWAGLWMRIDGPDSTTLSFDNMQNRPIKGTTNWKNYSIVLDVPENSAGIYYGILLDGRGQALVDGLQIETVSNEVPTTHSANGLIFFSQGQFNKAVEAFQEEFMEDNPDDNSYIYNHLAYFLSLSRAGQIDKARKHIAEFSKSLKDDKWIAPVAQFYAGKTTEDAVLKAAENEDEQIATEQKCEAYYYIGMMNLLKGDMPKAKDDFKKCVSTDVKYFMEYNMAKAELEKIRE